MNFADRTYPNIVRDLLTVLTGGTVKEVHSWAAGQTVLLRRAPVRRVSHLAASWEEDGESRTRRYSERDFELVATPDAPGAYIGVRFRDGRGPQVDGPTVELEVNYYPTEVRPTPLTDVNVGSVVRTLLETVAREMAGQYAQLDRVYRSAFLETAEGSNLDKVVALADVRRRPRGHPVGFVRLSRRVTGPGTIFVPAGTVVTDGSQRYLTTLDATIGPGQHSVEIHVEGESARTEAMEPGTLVILERPIAGVDQVTNDEATWSAALAETDAELRGRAQRAFHQAGRGTVDALRYGLERYPWVRAVAIDEHRDGPGTVSVAVTLDPDDAEHRRLLARAIDRLRPAGVQVTLTAEVPWALGVELNLTLAGTGLSHSEEADVRSQATEVLDRQVAGLQAGGTLRIKPLIANLLADPRIVDLTITVSHDNQALTGDIVKLPADTAASTTVGFGPFTYQDAPSEADTVVVRVTAQLAVRLIDEEADGLHTWIEGQLSGWLEARAPGPLTFDHVATRIRDDARFALYRDDSQLTLEDESGLFSTLGDLTSAFEIQQRMRIQLADIILDVRGS